MNTLEECINHMLDSSAASSNSRRRVAAAMRTVKQEIGNPDLASMLGSVDPGRVVSVPESNDQWIVFGGPWDNGTFDIIKIDGSFPRDVLVGWSPGQPLSEYWSEVDDEDEEGECPSPIPFPT